MDRLQEGETRHLSITTHRPEHFDRVRPADESVSDLDERIDETVR